MATHTEQQDVLRQMIISFRVTDLQVLLGFAGKNRQGRKEELLTRALDLVKIRSVPMQAKIREIYKASQEAQQSTMMGQGGQPINPYQGVSYAALMGAYGAQQAQGLQGRNPYATGYAQQQTMAPVAAGVPQMAAAGHHGMYGAATSASPYQMAGAGSLPVHPDIKLIKLPFYDVNAELLKPASLLAQGGNRFHEAQFQFFLTPGQATDIASNRDIQAGSRMDYLYQIQLRFCPLSMENGKEMSDEFPPNLNVHVNGKMVQLPNPIPTNKPGVEPRRPPKPVNITPLCKLSPILPNTIGVRWAAEYGKGWVIAISLVMKLTSDDLLDRLRKKGTREPPYTKNLIIEKLNNDDEDIATTSLKVSVTCPLGKMRMKVSCRPVTCNHLQCFDASTFLQMNERKPTWNCPVCDKKALYDDLLIDGYFQEILDSKQTADENDIILERDGSWKVPEKEDEKEAAKVVAGSSNGGGETGKTVENGGSVEATTNGTAAEGGGGGGSKKPDEEVDCITLSDDDDDGAPSNPPLPPGGPPLPVAAPPPLPPQPPPPQAEIECIDLD